MKCDELKYERLGDAFNDYPDSTLVIRKQFVDAAIAELETKLENVQATAYVEIVDAGMENRKLKRALWLARANDASSFAGLFSTLSYIDDDESRTYWIFGNKRKIVIDGLKCSRMETAYKWFCIWDDVANKCLKKAKEYK